MASNRGNPISEQLLMLEAVTPSNCGQKLKLLQESSSMSRRELAAVIGVSESTVRRIESRDTTPTEEFMNRLHALCVIGRAKFGNMTDAEKDAAVKLVGAGSEAVISADERICPAGIRAGMAALASASLIGGLVASIPVAAAAISGFGLVKALAAVCAANKLTSEEVDGRWEIRKL